MVELPTVATQEHATDPEQAPSMITNEVNTVPVRIRRTISQCGGVARSGQESESSVRSNDLS
jgi:hypothetical protein